MKKLSIIATGLLSLGCLCADDSAGVKTMEWQSKLSGNVGMKFETEHLNRGRREIPGCTFVPSAEVSYQLFDAARAYVGADSVLRAKSDGFNDIAPYIGCMYDINDMFTVDLGYIHHFHNYATSFAVAGGITGSANSSKDTNEIYAGVLVDVMFSPSLYCEYDFDFKEINIVADAAYYFDLSQYSISGLGVDLGIKFGYDRADKPWGSDYVREYDGDKDYVYYGASADLVYSITDSAKARAGVAYEGNSAKKEAWPVVFGKHKNAIWFNASVDCAF